MRSEGRVGEKQLIDDDACGPPVDALVVASPFQNLRRVVLWSASYSASQLRLIQPPGQAEVNQLEESLVVEHKVLQLEVSVHDVSFVQGLEAQDQLKGQELDRTL